MSLIDKFWVGSNGDQPERVYFSYESMIHSVVDRGNHTFIDVFDGSGERIERLKIVYDENTDEFISFTTEF